MRDRYIPPFEIKTLEQLIRVFGSWNHHAEPGGAWRLYSKEEHDDSPSRRDGVSADIEARYKKLLVTLIWKVAEALNSPMVTIAAAAILLQRFYGERSFVHNDKLVIATACLFLAGKMEDTPRSLHRISEEMFRAFCAELSPMSVDAAKARWQNTAYQENFKAAVLAAERCLLFTLGFNFSVIIPQKCLLHPEHGIATALNSSIEQACASAPPSRDLQKVHVQQAAYDVCNDSLKCDVVMRHTPLAIAVSSMHFSLKWHRILEHMPGGAHWYTRYTVSEDQIFEVCHAMGEMYREYAPQGLAVAPPNQDTMAAPVNAHAVGSAPLGTASSVVAEPRNAEQQQAWLQAKAAAVGQHHVKQEPSGTPSSHRSDQTSQATASQPPGASTPVQPSLFMPIAATAQRGLDHKIRSNRRSADRGVPAVPKFAAPVTGSKRPKPASPARAVEAPQMPELIETDMF
ncbi:hypothetical protein ABBQ38_013346 [Trebouxia sp. C0009 RCD-2024]